MPPRRASTRTTGQQQASMQPGSEQNDQQQPADTQPADTQPAGRLPRQLVYLRLDEVKPAPRNPKDHDLPLLARMISHHGFVEVPAVDSRTGCLVAGHGRWEELLELHAAGQDPPDGIIADPDGMWRMPAVTGWQSRSDPDAEAYLVGSNEATTAGGWLPGLADVLVDLRQRDLLALTGFTDQRVNDMLAGIKSAPLPDPGDADTGASRPSMFGVIVECDTEDQQVNLLEKLTEEGFQCRALL